MGAKSRHNSGIQSEDMRGPELKLIAESEFAMRVLVLGLSLLVGGLALADSDRDIRVNRIEVSAVASDESDGDSGDDAPDSKATDYNSSRSNKADTSAPTD